MLVASLALHAAALGAAPTVAEKESLHRFLQQRERDDRSTLRGETPIRYSAAFADLNGDGRNEAIVYLSGDGRCGSGGCGVHIYARRGGSWREVTDIGPARLPVRLLNSKAHGWRDLSVFVAGGGILPGYHAQLKFDGRSYPYNPTDPPARPLRKAPPGRILIPAGAIARPLF